MRERRQNGHLRDVPQPDDAITNRTGCTCHQEFFLFYFFLPLLRLRPPRFRGTFPPFSRASLRAIAIACFRLFTREPELLLSVPFFRRSIADVTRFFADLPSLAITTSAVHDANAMRAWHLACSSDGADLDGGRQPQPHQPSSADQTRHPGRLDWPRSSGRL